MNINELVLYRRKREGRTNYKKRLIYLKSKQARLVVRKTNKQVILQLVEYLPDGDKIICGTSSNALKKQGWKYSCKSMPAYYLTGLLIAKIAKEKHVTGAIVDFGLQTNVLGSNMYAAVKGAIDGGLKIPMSDEAFPTEERIKGAHIAAYYSINESEKQFSAYKKEKIDASKISTDFESMKKKLMAK
jgi:large subunit ribosomal protein L18